MSPWLERESATARTIDGAGSDGNAPKRSAIAVRRRLTVRIRIAMRVIAACKAIVVGRARTLSGPANNDVCGRARRPARARRSKQLLQRLMSVDERGRRNRRPMARDRGRATALQQARADAKRRRVTVTVTFEVRRGVSRDCVVIQSPSTFRTNARACAGSPRSRANSPCRHTRANALSLSQPSSRPATCADTSFPSTLNLPGRSRGPEPARRGQDRH